MIALLTLLACAPDGSEKPAPTDTAIHADTGEDTGQDTQIYPDLDEDGYGQDVDCNDDDAHTFPGAAEICGDGVINDCDGTETAAVAACEHVLTEYGATAAWPHGGVDANLRRVAPLGDVNGDGLDDIGIGALHTGYDDGTANEVHDSGIVFVFDGPITGTMGDMAAFDSRFMATPEWDYASWDTVPMGDVDGDGYDDFAVGASDTIGGPVTGTPSVYLVHGPVVDTVWSSDDMVLLQGNTIEDCLGSSLAPTADADGDGVADLLVGGRCQGQAHLVSGDGHGMIPEDDDIAFFYVPDPDGTGAGEDSRFGYTLASGDLDGDGLLDVAVGAPESESSGPKLGFVSIFADPQDGAHSSDDADTTIAATEDDGDLPVRSPVSIQFGTSLTIGDWNHDGHDDIAVGAPLRHHAGNERPAGSTSIYFGPLGTGTQGLPSADLTIHGDDDNDRVGGELDGDDDIDGDGVDDLLIGSGRYEVDGYSGLHMSGSTSQRAWVLMGPLTGGTMLAGDADVVLHKTEPTEENGYLYGGFGLQARVAGDTDGDGRKELLVGDWSAALYLFDIGDVGGY